MADYHAVETAVCGDCIHFRQHYIKQGYRYTPIYYGHCVYPRLKKRSASHERCRHWKARTPTP